MKAIKSYTHYIVAVILFFLLKFLVPAANGLTQQGVLFIAILVPTLYLWCVANTDWVSLLALAALAISGLMKPNQIWAGSYGSFIVVLIIVCMALSAVLTETGVIDKVASWFITRRFIKGHPYAFIAMYMLSFYFLGTFIEATALTVIYIALTLSIFKSIGVEKGEKLYAALMAGLLWGNSAVSAGSPISHTLPILMMNMLKNKGIDVSFGQWLSVGIPFEILLYILYMLVVMFVWKPDVSKILKYDVDAVKANSKPLSAEGWVAAILFIVTVIVWLFPQFGKNIAPSAASALQSWSTTVPAIVTLSLLCVIRIKGKPIATFSSVAKNIPIGLLTFTGAVTLLGSAIELKNADGVDIMGIIPWMRNILTPISEALPLWLLLTVLVFLSLVMTNFLSNTVTMFLFAQIALALWGDSNVINVVAFVVIITMTSCIGIATPSASVPAPLFFGPGHIDVKSTWKYALCYCVAITVFTMLLIWPLAQKLI